MCNILNSFNDFYIDISQEIGINDRSADSSATHSNIQAIKENSPKKGMTILILNLSVDLKF